MSDKFSRHVWHVSDKRRVVVTRVQLMMLVAAGSSWWKLWNRFLCDWHCYCESWVPLTTLNTDSLSPTLNQLQHCPHHQDTSISASQYQPSDALWVVYQWTVNTAVVCQLSSKQWLVNTAARTTHYYQFTVSSVIFTITIMKNHL